MVRGVPVVGAGITFPEVIEFAIADAHVVEPLGLPLIEVGGADPGDGGAEGSVCARAVAAEEDSEVEGGP